MKKQIINKIKALFLLVVFSLNTIAGFACSIGIDMGYNNKHHAHGHDHSDLHRHHPSKVTHAHRHVDVSDLSVNNHNEKDDCCSNDVTTFNKLDKSLATQVSLQVPFFVESITSLFIVCNNSETSSTVNSNFEFVRRSCFLNDINIQTVISRFQI